MGAGGAGLTDEDTHEKGGVARDDRRQETHTRTHTHKLTHTHTQVGDKDSWHEVRICVCVCVCVCVMVGDGWQKVKCKHCEAPETDIRGMCVQTSQQHSHDRQQMARGPSLCAHTVLRAGCLNGSTRCG